MGDTDFARACPKCGKNVLIAADRAIKRARCGGCRTVYGITRRIGGELDLLPIQSREHAGIRARLAQIGAFKRWVVLLFAALVLFLCGVAAFAFLPLRSVLGSMPAALIAIMILLYAADRAPAASRRRRRRRSSPR